MTYKDKLITVPGKKARDIFIFALSTCIWCKKTKQLLKKLGIEYRYLDVDLLDEKEKNEAERDMKKFTDEISFPTIVIDNKKTISGYVEDEIMELNNNG